MLSRSLCLRESVVRVEGNISSGFAFKISDDLVECRMQNKREAEDEELRDPYEKKPRLEEDDDDVEIVHDDSVDGVERAKGRKKSDLGERPTHRQLYTFLIQLGIRLKLKNRSVCTSILVFHEVLKNDRLADNICNYTLATACLMVGLKYEEERGIRIKPVCHAAQSLVSDVFVSENSEEVSALANGVGKLEFIVLREIGFKVNFDHPHKHQALILQSLRTWAEQDFEKYPILETAASILRDAYISPEFILDYPPKAIAITVVSLALKAFDISIPSAHSDWYKAFSSSMRRKELKSIERKLIDIVYGVRVKDD